MSADRIAAGMNRYRAWIDGAGWRVLVASQLLSVLVLGTLFGLVYGFTEAWTGVAYALVALLPLEVFLGVAQMTSWRFKP